MENIQYTFIAKTLAGLEEVLAQELKEIGASEITPLVRAVSFVGDKRMLYKANYTLRTAQRILQPLFSFPLIDEEDLYKHIYDFEWEKYMLVKHTIAMDAVVSHSSFTHSHFVSLRAKDALVDRFRDKNNGRRPSVDTENPDFKINIHILEDRCDISLDSSGASLHKRGYRVGNAEAPLSEVLAAGLIRLSGWDANSNFIDPMCGSGTLLIEAAMFANNFPAGMYREKFSFMNWFDFDEQLWEEVKDEAFEKQVEFDHKIIGYDISGRNLSVARANVNNARLHKDIELAVRGIEDFQAPEGRQGTVIINPPYGERVRVDDIIGLYKIIGDVLKRNLEGYKAWVISADLTALKFIGLHPSKRYTVFNGQLECKFECFEVYKGSKKNKDFSSDDFSKREEKEESQGSDFQENKTEKSYNKSADKDRGDRRYNRRDDDKDRGERRYNKRDDDKDRGERRYNRRDDDKDRGERRYNRRDDDKDRKFDRKKSFDKDRKFGDRKSDSDRKFPRKDINDRNDGKPREDRPYKKDRRDGDNFKFPKREGDSKRHTDKKENDLSHLERRSEWKRKKFNRDRE